MEPSDGRSEPLLLWEIFEDIFYISLACALVGGHRLCWVFACQIDLASIHAKPVQYGKTRKLLCSYSMAKRENYMHVTSRLNTRNVSTDSEWVPRVIG